MLITTGKTSWVLPFLVPVMMMLVLPTPATSGALGNSETSASINFANSFSLKQNQNLPLAKSSSALSSASSVTPTSRGQDAAMPLSKKSSTPLPPAEYSASPPSIFTWGHVTKYSRILYDKSVVVKGPIVLDVKYPEIDNSNSFTIIGIQVFANQDVTTTADLNSGRTTGNAQLQVYPLKGGIGHNATIIRFSLNSTRELHYTLVIHGVDV